VEERGKGESGWEKVDIAFSLVYATPLLHCQAQFGLNPALFKTYSRG